MSHDAQTSPERIRVALLGARGFTGQELLRLLAGHPRFALVLATSRELTGQPIASHLPDWPNPEQRFEQLTDEALAQRDFDLAILAMPNGASARIIAALDAVNHPAALLDLSADWRFDPAWVYGSPERNRALIRGARRVANPGCYATGAQLAIWPVLDLLDGVPHVFGISGYSGAGSTPSEKNDPEVLRDNLLPYALVDHMHEREVSHQLGRAVAFMPHVAPFFRGITLTVSLPLAATAGATAETLRERYQTAYANEPLVGVQRDIPRVRDAMLEHHVTLGGVTVDAAGARAVIVVTLDNLLKGAATQAMQNMNLMCGLDELLGIPVVL